MTMNARVNPGEIAVATCRVAAIARQIAALNVAHNREDERSPEDGCPSRRSAHRAMAELQDAIEALSLQASWLTPTSPQGAMLTALLLSSARNDVVEYTSDHGSEVSSATRKAERLERRLIEYFERTAGRSVEEHGLSYLYATYDPSSEAAAIVREG